VAELAGAALLLGDGLRVAAGRHLRLARVAERKKEGGTHSLLSAMFGFFLLGAVLTAALYGVFADLGRNDPARVIGAACAALVSQASTGSDPAMVTHCREWLAFQRNLFTLSMWMAGGLGMIGTLTEWVRTRRQ
jgi:hypothetical protein